ncbi:hypothetical protein DYB32_009691 [Aphanomyces invadans]|uniref:Uncharacterized protein n=1 Tax=Aphanomyces invadans TaxID=157072 RepID=A0A418AHR7_9STRA|nr:hypothetical protein DYB32_009691 [Aphanomyces invadans]
MILPPVQQLIAYRQKTTNNKCSDVRCDDVWLTRADLFGVESARESFSGTTVDDPLDEWKTCMGAPITNNEWTKLTTSVFTASRSKARSCVPGLQLPPPTDRVKKELHFDVSCDSTAPDFATFCTSQLQVKMSDLFALEATLNPNPTVTALLTGRTTSAASIVFWRVKNECLMSMLSSPDVGFVPIEMRPPVKSSFLDELSAFWPSGIIW